MTRVLIEAVKSADQQVVAYSVTGNNTGPLEARLQELGVDTTEIPGGFQITPTAFYTSGAREILEQAAGIKRSPVGR